MDILKPLVKHFTYNFFVKRDGLNVKKHLSELNRSQFYSSDEIACMQLDRLKKIIDHAYHNSEFYQKRFRDAQKRGRIRG